MRRERGASSGIQLSELARSAACATAFECRSSSGHASRRLRLLRLDDQLAHQSDLVLADVVPHERVNLVVPWSNSARAQTACRAGARAFPGTGAELGAKPASVIMREQHSLLREGRAVAKSPRRGHGKEFGIEAFNPEPAVVVRGDALMAIRAVRIGDFVAGLARHELCFQPMKRACSIP